jgi:hypothetical protein
MKNTIRDGGLEKFLTWPITREFLYAAYNVIGESDRALLPKAYHHLTTDWPYPRPPGAKSPEGASSTYIKQALAAWLATSDMIGSWANVNSVYEVGGGYGAMAVVLRAFGFSGSHTVLDLPALHLVREWYLSSPEIETVSVLEPEQTDSHVLIALHSLDELGPDTRLSILDVATAEFYVFGITKSFNGIDNSTWFREWCWSQDLFLGTELDFSAGNQEIILAWR